MEDDAGGGSDVNGVNASHWTLKERLKLTESLTQIQGHLAEISDKLDSIDRRMIHAEHMAEKAMARVFLHEQIVAGVSFLAAVVAAVYKILTMI